MKCKAKNGIEVFVTRCYDCESNLGGFFCQVYLDEDLQEEVDNLVIPAEVVDANEDDNFIREYVGGLELNVK